MYICICNAITEGQIRACAREGACTLQELECQLGVGTSCGRCKPAANDLLNENRSAARAVLAGTSA